MLKDMDCIGSISCIKNITLGKLVSALGIVPNTGVKAGVVDISIKAIFDKKNDTVDKVIIDVNYGTEQRLYVFDRHMKLVKKFSSGPSCHIRHNMVDILKEYQGDLVHDAKISNLDEKRLSKDAIIAKFGRNKKRSLNEMFI